MHGEIISSKLNQKYVNCISLGWFCGTAGSLSRLGLRATSSPFDWCLSDFWAVLRQIENGFEDFMKEDNIVVVDNKTIRDKEYGFFFPHDIKSNYYQEADNIHDKYCRRIKKFKQATLKPTVFFRCIRDDEEIEYINNNWKYAERLLKNQNENNKIVYVYREGLKRPTAEVESFCLNITEYVLRAYTVRHLFDNSEELLDFCTKVLPENLIRQNSLFDKQQNLVKSIAAYVNKKIEDNANGIDDRIINALHLSNNEEMYIWGAGKYGQAITEYLINRGVAIKGIIDNNPADKTISGVNVYDADFLNEEAKIFIAVSSNEANHSIEKQINELDRKIVIAKYLDLFDEYDFF